MPWITRAIFFAFGGLLVAAWLSYPYLSPAVMERICGPSDGCGTVAASKYARIGSVPVAFVGFAFYVLALAGTLAVMGWPAGAFRRRLLFVGVIAGASGALVSVGLMIIQFVLLRAFCPGCTLSAVCCLIWAGCVVMAWRRAESEHSAWGAAVLAAVLAGIAGLVALMVPGLSGPTPGGRKSIEIRLISTTPPDVLAVVNGTPITSLEMMKDRPAEMLGLQQSLYAAQDEWLHQRIARMLIESHAKSRGVEPNEMLVEEVHRRAEPELAYLKKWIEQQKKQDPAFDAWQIEQAAEQDARRRAVESFIAELRQLSKVEVRLPKPTGALEYDRAVAHVQGQLDFATVRLVLFSEFQCPYCAELAATLDQVLAKYSDVSLTFVHTPMSFHELAFDAAVAAECAAEQGRFWPFHDRLMKLQGQIEPTWEEYAKDIGLDRTKFRQSMQSGHARARVERARQAGLTLKLEGVPALYMNGRKIGGAISFEDLCAQIEVERKRPR